METNEWEIEVNGVDQRGPLTPACPVSSSSLRMCWKMIPRSEFPKFEIEIFIKDK